ncbi:MAG: PEGA domain-containing protein [Myxococcota bacterium]
MTITNLKRIALILVGAMALAGAETMVHSALPGHLGQSALAQDGDRDIEKAKERFRVGKTAFDEENYQKAAEAFLDAYRFSGRSELLFNVAQSYRRAGDLRNAETYFQKYLEEMPDASNADQVVEKIIEIQEEMAEQMATVDVETSPPGLNVFVDDEESARCQSPCSISLLPGEHRLTARDADGSEASTTATVEAQEETSVTIQVEAAVQTGQLDISTDVRSGTMTVAGQGTQQLPLTSPLELPVGTHDITVEADGKTWRGTIDVPANQTKRILVPLGGVEQQGGSPLRSASFGLGGASIGFLVGGILMGRASNDTFDALQSRQNTFGSVDQDMIDRGKSQQTGANILYGASIATFSAGVGLFVWDMMSSGSTTESEEQIPPSEPSDDSDDDANIDLLGSR